MTSTPSPTSRIHGCLLGAAASEAAVLAAGAAGTTPGDGTLHLGAAGQLTFYTADALVEVLEWANAGVYADQTACVWLAYLRWADAQGVPLPASAPSAPARWIDTQPATNHQLPVRPAWVASLAGGEMGTQARPLGAAYDDGAAAARSAAFGLVAGTPADAVAAMALDGAHLTHGHPSAVQAAAAIALIVRELAAGGSLRSAVETASTAQSASRNPAADVVDALEGALTGRHSGEPWSPAARALGAALEAALDAASDAVPDAASDDVPDAVPDAGGESGADTDGAAFRAAVDRAGAAGPDAAAMTGALLGALWGADAVPEEWASRLEGSDIAAEIAATLARASGAED